MASTAGTIRERISSLPVGTFVRPRDFADLSSTAVDMTLSRLAHDDAYPLVRVAHGLYWRGVESRFGAGRPDSLAVALELGGAGAGPAGWSAARTLGLTTQVPAKVEVAAVNPHTSTASTCFRRRANTLRVNLRAIEVAVLELLRDGVEKFGATWASLVASVRALVDDAQVRVDNLRDAIGAESRSSAEAFYRLVADLGAA
ncbi:MAG: DUF6088 family protein [Actinomycetia bacterium]|nr:DUF6088 family protein [Actinomycetes bacterium]